jgi:hypothetical protein
VSVKIRQGELKPYAEVEDVWIQLKGIPPMWCDWEVLDQFALSYGLLEDVDWQGIFSSFYETGRMKIKCRDASKIPCESLFCIDKKLYKIAITLELPKEGKAQQISGSGSRKGQLCSYSCLEVQL